VFAAIYSPISVLSAFGPLGLCDAVEGCRQAPPCSEPRMMETLKVVWGGVGVAVYLTSWGRVHDACCLGGAEHEH
jgi:hypothetical protein